jgi:hypothetical protein
MIAEIKNFDFINGEWVECSYPCNIGYSITGSDGIERKILMSAFDPNFPAKSFDFVFQVWAKTVNKEGALVWAFAEEFKLIANKKTWINLSTFNEYSEKLPASDPFSAWNEVPDIEVVDENGNGTGVWIMKNELKPECQITNFDFWHNQIFGVVKPVLSGSMIKKGYYEITEVQ